MPIKQVVNSKTRFRSDGYLQLLLFLPEAFTEQNHLLNSTMKNGTWKKITEYFAKELEYLYTPEAKKYH